MAGCGWSGGWSLSGSSVSGTAGALPGRTVSAPRSDTRSPVSYGVCPPKGRPAPEEAWLSALDGVK
jgi:hypothetical protein